MKTKIILTLAIAGFLNLCFTSESSSKEDKIHKANTEFENTFVFLEEGIELREPRCTDCHFPTGKEGTPSSEIFHNPEHPSHAAGLTDWAAVDNHSQAEEKGIDLNALIVYIENL